MGTSSVVALAQPSPSPPASPPLLVLWETHDGIPWRRSVQKRIERMLAATLGPWTYEALTAEEAYYACDVLRRMGWRTQSPEFRFGSKRWWVRARYPRLRDPPPFVRFREIE